jgi:hypothetical protein
MSAASSRLAAFSVMSFLSGAIDQVYRLSFFIKAFVYEATA